MAWFNRKALEEKAVEKQDDSPVQPPPAAEYIWGTGYKGVRADLTAHNDFQYEIGKEFTIDEDPVLCTTGFHFCPSLKDVFNWCPIGVGNRYFKVKALVSKKSLSSYSTVFDRKVVAKSIILTEEVTDEEIFREVTDHGETLDPQFWAQARSENLDAAFRSQKLYRLSFYYSNDFANWLLDSRDHDLYKLALGLGSEEDLSQEFRIKALIGSRKTPIDFHSLIQESNSSFHY